MREGARPDSIAAPVATRSRKMRKIMSKGRGRFEQQRRAVAQIERRPAAIGQAQVVEDPITIGLDRTINVDLSKLSAPTNVYDADFAIGLDSVASPGSRELFDTHAATLSGRNTRTAVASLISSLPQCRSGNAALSRTILAVTSLLRPGRHVVSDFGRSAWNTGCGGDGGRMNARIQGVGFGL